VELANVHMIYLALNSHLDMSANIRLLGPPTTDAGLGASKTPSRAETWIENIGSDQLSEKNTTSPTKSNWSSSLEEKSAAAIDKKNRDRDLEMAPGNALVAERRATDQAEDPDADRYLTGFRLFLLFMYVNPYLKWGLY
jgi:hypothetical protein